jgi:hypothetical protein
MTRRAKIRSSKKVMSSSWHVGGIIKDTASVGPRLGSLNSRMHKIRRPKPRLALPVSDQAPMITSDDVAFSQDERTSAATGVASEVLQTSKIARAPSLSEMIEERTRENDRLREVLAYQKTKQRGELYLLEEVTVVVHKLQNALIEYHKLQRETDHNTRA